MKTVPYILVANQDDSSTVRGRLSVPARTVATPRREFHQLCSMRRNSSTSSASELSLAINSSIFLTACITVV